MDIDDGRVRDDGVSATASATEARTFAATSASPIWFWSPRCRWLLSRAQRLRTDLV